MAAGFQTERANRRHPVIFVSYDDIDTEVVEPLQPSIVNLAAAIEPADHFDAHPTLNHRAGLASGGRPGR